MIKEKTKKRYWYYVEINECPVCGRQDKIRERVYGKKPKDLDKRYRFTSHGCLGGACRNFFV